MGVRVGLWRKLSAEELMLFNCGVGEDSWESLGLQGDPISPFWRRSPLEFLWREWCWNWNSSSLATSCEELAHWCWEGLEAGGEGDDRGWDGRMASVTGWTQVWVNSRSWWWTGRPGVLGFMESQSRRWLSQWTDLNLSLALKPQVQSLVPRPQKWTPEQSSSLKLTEPLFNHCPYLLPTPIIIKSLSDFKLGKDAYSGQPLFSTVTNHLLTIFQEFSVSWD